MMIAKRPTERRNRWLVGVLVLLLSACGTNEQASLAQEAEQNAELWPRHVQTEDAEITIFQPQIDNWAAYLSLDGW